MKVSIPAASSTSLLPKNKQSKKKESCFRMLRVFDLKRCTLFMWLIGFISLCSLLVLEQYYFQAGGGSVHLKVPFHPSLEKNNKKQMFFPSNGHNKKALSFPASSFFGRLTNSDNHDANSIRTFDITTNTTSKKSPGVDLHREGAVNSHTHFIVLTGGTNGQGAGNHLQGLLAAHLFGLEFNRTVCLEWVAFWEAFEYTDPEHEKLCQHQAKNIATRSSGNLVSLWNFGSGKNVDECFLYDKLASRKTLVVTMSGNTYPGWRTDIPQNFFHRYYKPKDELLNFLPYKQDNPPKVVVHLRFPDGNTDQERGLDEESLAYLGEMLRGNGTYLVTNRPDWYRLFHECCDWIYDTHWEDKPIKHGAMDIIWLPNGQRLRGKDKIAEAFNVSTTKRVRGSSFEEHVGGNDHQNLKLWSDWYTMLRAEKVYHSNSDFSRSAVHWNASTTGYQLFGMKNEDGQQNEQQDNDEKVAAAARVSLSSLLSKRTSKQTSKRTLNLIPAPYDAVSIRIPPLVERIRDDKYHTEDDCIYLRFCRPNHDVYGSKKVKTYR
ncbi:hypothetical protein ACA910_003897 [Epithemia clementina (nom. ined.)]